MKESFTTALKNHFKQLDLTVQTDSPSLRIRIHQVVSSHTSSLSFKSDSDKIVHLWEDVWHLHSEIVESRIGSLLGKSKRIHARSTQVKRIEKKKADAFLNQNHLQGTTSAYYKYGLFLKDELIAVSTFSKSRIMHDGVVPYRSYEWERFACRNGISIVGGIGKILSAFIKEIHPAHIMTYIDKDWSTGSGYASIGFVRKEEILPQTYWVKPGEWKRYPIHKLPEGINAENDLKANGYVEVKNSGSIKMVLDLRRG